MLIATRGRYRAREALNGAEIRRCQELRHLAFREARGLPWLPDRRDADSLDALHRHVLVEDEAGRLIACLRYRALEGEAVMGGYAARYYGLEGLTRYPAPMIETGRFCVRPGWREPAIVCTALSALLRVARANRAGLIFGCASFEGARPRFHAAALAQLAANHLLPATWRPGPRARETVRLRGVASGPATGTPKRLPPLLRAYLALGGRVSDHAVVDRDLDTLHVFIAVELAHLPASWRRRLGDPGEELHDMTRNCAA